ncbi:hypothetical protein PR048_019193 [Dryococelus australis]|uniref:Uncharacterized protein n=1 Tax=Dryococelus australis TaxID=614101 RepID=A0ABQ9H2U2_9NEOP|nr:hypothetical protein PR048_019193 [Dryococelus australis]
MLQLRTHVDFGHGSLGQRHDVRGSRAPISASLSYDTVSLDRRMNKVMRPKAILILHKAEEHTTCIQADLKQDNAYLPEAAVAIDSESNGSRDYKFIGRHRRRCGCLLNTTHCRMSTCNSHKKCVIYRQTSTAVRLSAQHDTLPDVNTWTAVRLSAQHDTLPDVNVQLSQKVGRHGRRCGCLLNTTHCRMSTCNSHKKCVIYRQTSTAVRLSAQHDTLPDVNVQLSQIVQNPPTSGIVRQRSSRAGNRSRFAWVADDRSSRYTTAASGMEVSIGKQGRTSRATKPVDSSTGHAQVRASTFGTGIDLPVTAAPAQEMTCPLRATLDRSRRGRPPVEALPPAAPHILKAARPDAAQIPRRLYFNILLALLQFSFRYPPSAFAGRQYGVYWANEDKVIPMPNVCDLRYQRALSIPKEREDTQCYKLGPERFSFVSVQWRCILTIADSGNTLKHCAHARFVNSSTVTYGHCTKQKSRPPSPIKSVSRPADNYSTRAAKRPGAVPLMYEYPSSDWLREALVTGLASDWIVRAAGRTDNLKSSDTAVQQLRAQTAVKATNSQAWKARPSGQEYHATTNITLWLPPIPEFFPRLRPGSAGDIRATLPRTSSATSGLPGADWQMKLQHFAGNKWRHFAGVCGSEFAVQTVVSQLYSQVLWGPAESRILFARPFCRKRDLKLPSVLSRGLSSLLILLKTNIPIFKTQLDQYSHTSSEIRFLKIAQQGASIYGSNNRCCIFNYCSKPPGIKTRNNVVYLGTYVLQSVVIELHTLATSQAMLEVSSWTAMHAWHGLTKPLQLTWLMSNSSTGVIDALFHVVDVVNRHFCHTVTSSMLTPGAPPPPQRTRRRTPLDRAGQCTGPRDAKLYTKYATTNAFLISQCYSLTQTLLHLFPLKEHLADSLEVQEKVSSQFLLPRTHTRDSNERRREDPSTTDEAVFRKRNSRIHADGSRTTSQSSLCIFLFRPSGRGGGGLRNNLNSTAFLKETPCHYTVSWSFSVHGKYNLGQQHCNAQLKTLNENVKGAYFYLARAHAHTHTLCETSKVGTIPCGLVSSISNFTSVALRNENTIKPDIKMIANGFEATVAERLVRSPSTNAIRVQSPAGSLRILACGNRAGRCRCWSLSLPSPVPLHSNERDSKPRTERILRRNGRLFYKGEPPRVRDKPIGTRALSIRFSGLNSWGYRRKNVLTGLARLVKSRGPPSRHTRVLEFGGLYGLKHQVCEDSETTSPQRRAASGSDKRPAVVKSADCEHRLNEHVMVNKRLVLMRTCAVAPTVHSCLSRSQNRWEYRIEMVCRFLCCERTRSLTGREKPWERARLSLIGYCTVCNTPYWSSCRLASLIGEQRSAILLTGEAILPILLASYHGDPGFSHVGIILDEDVGRRIFSGISRFPRHFIPRCSILTSITLIGSQDLDVESRPNLFTHHFSSVILRHSCGESGDIAEVKEKAFLKVLPFPHRLHSAPIPPLIHLTSRPQFSMDETTRISLVWLLPALPTVDECEADLSPPHLHSSLDTPLITDVDHKRRLLCSHPKLTRVRWSVLAAPGHRLLHNTKVELPLVPPNPAARANKMTSLADERPVTCSPASSPANMLHAARGSQSRQEARSQSYVHVKGTAQRVVPPLYTDLLYDSVLTRVGDSMPGRAKLHIFAPWISAGMQGRGGTGDTRENPPTIGIVQQDSHIRATPPGIEPGSILMAIRDPMLSACAEDDNQAAFILNLQSKIPCATQAMLSYAPTLSILARCVAELQQARPVFQTKTSNLGHGYLRRHHDVIATPEGR